MSEHFATSLKSYLERTRTKAVDLEKAAGVPASTVGKLITGVRPSVERLDEILKAIPSTESAKLLEAYLRDAVPQQWRDAVQIIIITVAEIALQSAPPEVKDKLTRTLEAISNKARSDIDFAAWLLDTAQLMQLTPDPEPTPAALYTLPDLDEPSAKVAEES